MFLIADPGGKEEDIRVNNSKILTNNRTNGVSVNSFLKATKDQLITSSSFLPTSNHTQQSNNNVISSTTITATSGLINNNSSNTTTNDSKYLHKKFKKFCATVDSNQQTTNLNNNFSSNNFNHTSSSSHNSDRNTNTAATSNNTTTTFSSFSSVVTNNNSEIVENKNSSSSNSSWIPQPQETSLTNYNHHQFQSVPSTVSLAASAAPKHLQTTEEEKQLVKDIIDINNENFMHQSANHSLSLQNSASSFLITNASSGGPLVTVTLGNHNSNYQTAELRGHKVIAGQEPGTIAFNSSNQQQQTPNGNFVIINNQLSSVDYSHQQLQQQQQALGATSSAPSTGASTPTSTTPGPGRYICPYCQLNCAKPSVLQKHIRAHTNERPYPCTACGFAFKTKSNLYKHCR